MGHGMAGRYLDAGFTVSVWNRSKAKAEDLIARGARWATSPEDAAIDADAVVTMVADDNASREVWLTKDGAAAKTDIGWGHQIRSYVLQPYQLVKDLRTGVESTDPQTVLNGDLNDFMEAALAQRLGGNDVEVSDID